MDKLSKLNSIWHMASIVKSLTVCIFGWRWGECEWMKTRTMTIFLERRMYFASFNTKTKVVQWIVFTIYFVQMLNGLPAWESNAAVSLLLEKALCQWKTVESLSHSSSVYALCINSKVSTIDFFNRQQNFITLLCSFFTSIFASLNLHGITRTTFAKITVIWRRKVITRWKCDISRPVLLLTCY